MQLGRRFLLCAALLAAAGVAHGQGAEPARDPRALRLAQPNAARFPEVILYAYPTDERGLLLGGLRPEAFQVTEDGRPAAVLRAEAEGGAIDVCLALDRSPSMGDWNKLAYAKQAAHEFIRHLGADDRAALITFSSGCRLEQALTADRHALRAAVERAAISGDRTTFLDAVYWSIGQVALRAAGGGSVTGAGPARPEARRVVLALTDGDDRGSRALPSELLAYARDNGVSLCMVALGADAVTGQMQHLARESGGIYLRAPGPRELQGLYVALARELRREYRVTIRSPRPEPDAARRTVRVVLPGHALAADTWYRAPAAGSVLMAPGGPAAGAPVTGEDAGASPQVLIGAVLMALGLAGAGAALAVWMGARRRRLLPIVDSNPRLDLLPLWVRQGSTRIGRAPECELVLDSREVSRVHARIEAWDGVFRLHDEGSSNGTFVNGHRIRRASRLEVGDVIRFGDREFRFAGEFRPV